MFKPITNKTGEEKRQDEVMINGPLPGFEDEPDCEISNSESDKPVIVRGSRPALPPCPPLSQLLHLDIPTDYCVFYTMKIEDGTIVVKARFKSEYTPMDYHTIIHRTFQKYTKTEMIDMLAYIAKLLRCKSLIYKHAQDLIPDTASPELGELLFQQDYSLPKSRIKDDN